MSHRREYHLEGRFTIAPEDVERLRQECSPSERFTWVTQDQRLRIHTLKGVPGKHIDVLLPDLAVDLPCMEIGLKVGSYNGARRWRLTVRSWSHRHQPPNAPSLKFPGSGSLVIEEDHAAPDHLILLARWWGGGIWAQSFPKLQYELRDDSDLLGIFLYHWKTYYNFLDIEDARQAGQLWSSLPHTRAARDIVVLNRTASQALYDLARQSGWRKLTLREKRKCGLSDDSPQWQRVDLLLRQVRDQSILARLVGDYTNDAAKGEPLHQGEHDGYIMTSHGPVEIE